jgi:hypothetical protein
MRLMRQPILELPKEGFSQQEWNVLAILQWQTKSLVAEGKEPPLWICGEQARAAGTARVRKYSVRMSTTFRSGWSLSQG